MNASILWTEIGSFWRTDNGTFSNFWERAIFRGVIGRINASPISIMDILHTLLLSILYMFSFRTWNTFFLGNIKNGGRFLTDNTLSAIIEGSFNRTVRYIVISDWTLIILFDKVIDCQLSKDPARSIDVRLPDSWGKNNIHWTIGVNDGFDTIKEKQLFFNISFDLIHLITFRHSFC